jgi:hypothetical protein
VDPDTGEFVEVVTPTGTNLSSFSVVLYNGANGASYLTTSLTAFTAGASVGDFTIYSFTYPTDGIQNGAPDGIALVSGSSVLEFLSYEGTFTATNGPGERPALDRYRIQRKWLRHRDVPRPDRDRE